MLSLDLFYSRYERELREGAVDDLEYRRMNDLRDKMEYLMQAYKKADTDDVRQAIMKRYNEYKAEREGYLKIKEQQVPSRQDPFAYVKPEPKGIGDIQDPKQKMSQLAQKARKGPLANVAQGIKAFVKGEPEPMSEQEEPTSPTLTMSQQAVAELIKAWEGELDYIEVPLIDGSSVPITRPALFNTLVALKQQQTQRPKKYNEYIDKVFATKDGFMRWLANVPRFQTPAKKKKMQAQMGLDLQPPPLQDPAQATPAAPVAPAGPMVDPEFRKQAGLSERKSQKKKFRSAIAQREIEKAMAAYPSARDSIEALVLKTLDTDDRQDRVLKDLEQDINQVKSGQSKIAVAPVTEPTKPAAQTPTKVKAPAAPTPTAARVQPAPLTTTVPVPAPEPELTKSKKPRAKKTDTTVVTVKKPRVRKLPARDMGQAIEIPVSGQEAPALTAPKSDLPDMSDFQSLLGLQAEKEAEKVIQTAKQASKRQAAKVEEHGGGIGPRQHWQSLMQEARMKQALDDYKMSSEDLFYKKYKMTKRDFYNTVVNRPSARTSAPFKQPQACTQCGKSYESCVCENVKETFDMPGATIPRKSIIQGYTVFFNPETRTVSVTRGGDSEEAAIEQARLGTANLKTFRNATEKLIDRIEDQVVNEGVRDRASATAVIACLLVGGTLQGCATAPERQTTAQAVKTGQDVGRVIYNAKKITRAGTEEEVRQELKNIMRGVSGQPQELNHSNILRIWRRVNQPAPAQQPQNESREPTNQQEYFAIIDRLDKEIGMEQNRAVKQMLMKQREVLQQRAQIQGWIPKKELREDTAALAAEDAILKRIFVRHGDLMMEYGPDKITQAAEEVAYNVGDIAHITDEQINEWVKQVEYILGAKP